MYIILKAILIIDYVLLKLQNKQFTEKGKNIKHITPVLQGSPLYFNTKIIYLSTAKFVRETDRSV